MTSSHTAAIFLRCAARVYALALLLHSRRLRDRYGADMRATFLDRCRDAQPDGVIAVLVLVARELADVVVTAAASRRSTAGSHTRLNRFAWSASSTHWS